MPSSQFKIVEFFFAHALILVYSAGADKNMMGVRLFGIIAITYILYYVFR